MSSGPWWFAGVVGLVGIVVGAVLKWALDSLSERRKQQLESSSRFISDRRDAYKFFLRLVDRAAIGRINAWTNQAALDGDLPGVRQPPTREEQEEMRSFITAEKRAVHSAIEDAHEYLKVMRLLSSTSINEKSRECLKQLMVGNRAGFELAEQTFLSAVRQDLGISGSQTEDRRIRVDPVNGSMILGRNDPWPSPPGKLYPLSLALRRDDPFDEN